MKLKTLSLQAPSANTTTSYQQNLSTPAKQEKWYSGDQPTTREVLGRIGKIAQNNQLAGRFYATQFEKIRNDKTSPFYNPYERPTNKAVQNLAQYGIDTSKIDDDFFRRNDYLRQYLRYNGQTNTPSAPTSKSSNAERAAYEYYQIWAAQEQTNKAKTQWSALQDELSYWAKRKDRNYSDDEIINKINWSKYDELVKMDENKAFKPNEYNEAIGYSRDNMYGVIWAARNNGGTGNMDIDVMNSVVNNNYQRNQDIADRLNPDSDRYSPYSVGSTLEQEGLYFGRETFDQKWLDENRHYLTGNDETAKRMYQNVYDAEQRTQKLEAQLQQMNDDIDGMIKAGYSPEKVTEYIKDASEYSDLFNLDKTMAKADLVGTTRALNYRWQDIEASIRQKCEQRDGRKNLDQTVGETTVPAATTPTTSPAAASEDTAAPAATTTPTAGQKPGFLSDLQKEIDRFVTGTLKGLLPTIEAKGTDAEKIAARTGMTAFFDPAVDQLVQVHQGMVQKLRQNAERNLTTNYLDATRVVQDHEKQIRNRDGLQQQLDGIMGEWQTLHDKDEETRAIEDLDNDSLMALDALRKISAGDDYAWDETKAILERDPDDFSGLAALYSRVAGDQIGFDGSEENMAKLEQAKQWWQIIQRQTKDSPIEKWIAEANATGDDVDFLDETFTTPDGRELAVTLEKNEDGRWVMSDAVDEEGNRYSQEQAEDMLGYHRYEFLTQEEAERLELLTARKDELEGEIQSANEAIEANQSLYDEQKAEQTHLATMYAASAYLDGNQDTSFIPTLEYAASVGSTFVPTQWSTSNVFDEAIASGYMTREQASQEAAGVTVGYVNESAQLTALMNRLDSMSVEMPEDWRENIERRIAECDRQGKAAAYFMLDDAPGFADTASKAAEVAKTGSLGRMAEAIASGHYGARLSDFLYALGGSITASAHTNDMRLIQETIEAMTDEEKNRYFYLLGAEGQTAADEYFAHLSDPDYGILAARRQENFQNSIQEFASQNGWTAALAYGGSFATNLFAGPSALIYEVGQKIQGKEVSPINPAFDYQVSTEASRAGAKENFQNRLGGADSVGGKIGGILFDAFTSGVDSYLNGQMTGELFGAVGEILNDHLPNLQAITTLIDQGQFGGLTKFTVKAAGDLAHASSMGLNAASSAYRQAIMKGAKEDQATAMAVGTFFAETLTEVITVGNMREAFAGATQEEAAHSLSGMIKTLFSDGLEEALGEGINEYAEANLDRIVMGELSDYEQTIKSYTDKGYPRAVAEQLADKQLMSNVLNAAITGFISSGMSTGVSYVQGWRAENAQNAANEAQRAAAPEAQEETNTPQETTENQPSAEAPAQENASAPEEQESAPAPEAQASAVTSQEQLAHDLDILEQVSDADETAVTAAVTSVLNTGNRYADKAAAKLLATSGNTKTATRTMQELLTAAPQNTSAVKDAISRAVLTNGEGNTVLQSLMAKAANGETITRQDVDALMAAVAQDWTNPDTEATYQEAIKESRIADKAMEIFKAGEVGSQVSAAEDQVKQAKENEANMGQALEDAQANVEAVASNLQAVEAEYDPSIPETAGPLQQTTNELKGADAMVQQAEDNLAIAQGKTQDARDNLSQTQDAAMQQARTQATVEVEQEMQAEAEAAAVAAEQARVQAEEQAQAQIAADEESSISRMDADAFIAQNNPDATPEEQETVRRIFEEERANLQQESQAQQPTPQTPQEVQTQRDLQGQKRRNEFIRKVSKKFGVDIRVMDTTNGGKVNRQEGYNITGTNVIILDQQTTLDDAMYRVLVHELTHVAERSGTYDQLAKALARMKYGDDIDRFSADIRQKKAEYDRYLAAMHEQDNSINGDPITPQDATKEIIADMMGELIQGDQELIDRFVAEDPSVARRLLESIKSFLKKAVGIKGEWVSQTQRTVDMLETALKEAQKNRPITPSVNAATTVKGGTRVVRMADGSINTFDMTSDNVARVYQSLYKTNIPVKELSADIQAVRNMVISGDDQSAAQAVRDLAQKIVSGAGMNRSNKSVSAIATALNNFFGKEISISQKEADSIAKTYGSLPKANKLLASAGVKAKMVVGGESSALDQVFVGDYHNGEGNPFQAELANALGDDYAITMEDVLDRLGHMYSGDQHGTFLSETFGTNDENALVHNVFDDLLSDVYAYKPYKETRQAKPIVQTSDGETLAEEFRGGTVAVKYSLNSFNQSEQDRTREVLLNVTDDNGNRLYTPEQVDEYMDNALGIAAMIAADRNRLDFEANPYQKFLKSNDEYFFSLDASTLCAKRLLYQGTFNYVQHALPDEVFTPEDLIDLVNIMAEMGYETPCGICYVESRRRWLDTYARQFLDKIAADPEGFVEKNFKKATPEEKEAMLKSLKGDKPSIDDLTTSDGLERLRTENPEMHKAYVTDMNKKGSQNPKVVQLRTEYRGEIGDLSDNDIQKVKNIGGLRIQSFSDFETPHLLDMMQAVMDMAGKRLTAQAYTKVPNFAWVFGDTGIKINLSLIGKGTGLDADGNLVFDNREGINFDEAMKLRDRYSKNVGTILVGISDEHIIAAMADPRVDMIIPFHKSGWSDNELRGIPSLRYYNDFTDYQNERAIIEREEVTKEFKGKSNNEEEIQKWMDNRRKDGKTSFTVEKVDGKTIVHAVGYKTESFTSEGKRLGIPESKRRVNFEPVGAHKYWDFTQNGEWNARKYLQMCKEDHRLPKFWQFLVDNGDGSFSLPEGDDKRSKAIREGYYKVLTDFKMYDNDGVGADQMEVTPNINMVEAQRVLNEHELGRRMPNGQFTGVGSNNDVPVATDAGDVFINLIKDKRSGNKPTPPNKPLEAVPDSIDVASLGPSAFGQTDESTRAAATILGSYQGPVTMGNTQSEYQESGRTQQSAMAIDAETGETVQRQYSLPAPQTRRDQEYNEAVLRQDEDWQRRLVDQQAEETMADSAIRDEAGRLLKVYHGTSEQFNSFDMSKGRANMDIQGAFFSPWEFDAEGYGENVREFYLNITNPASEREGYAALRRFKGQNEAGKKAREYLISQGYDGVVNGVPGQPEEIIAFYPEQIKLADPTTYDDDGNIIPLSERFQSQQRDIRYSLPSEDVLRQQIRQYLRDGGSLSNPSNLPGQPTNLPGRPASGGGAYRQFGRQTAQRSNALHDEVKQYLWENSEYTPDSNEAQINRALDWVQSHANDQDNDGYFTAMNEVLRPDFDYRSADGQARMLTVMGMAALKGDISGETRLADAFNRQGTDLGRQLQARKLFQLMTPLGRESVLQGLMDGINDEYKRKGRSTRVKLSEETREAARRARTQKDFQQVRKQAAQELAAQMPSSWKEKLQSWRMLAMLGNPRTHVRNFLGNLTFMPAVAIKNKVGALSEIVSRQEERTKTLGLASREARAFAKQDALEMQPTLTGEAKYNDQNPVQQARKIWGQGTGLISRTAGKTLQKISDFNSAALEGEDWIFLQRHYRNALAGYMTANKLTAADMTGETLDAARAYAVQEAQKATYRDASKLASTLSRIGNEGGIAGFIVNAALPFKKTPANILKRGLEYSPAGLLKAFSVDAYHLKQYHEYQNGKLEALPEKALSPTQWIDRMASGLTGSGILALGAALAKAGFVSAGFGDDEDEFDKLEGAQEYALTFNIFGQEVSYTVDWAAPTCMPFFVGATIANTFGKDVDATELVDALLGITEPVFNLSMLDGVNSLLDVSQYGEGNPITQIGEKIATNYATSYWPTLFGQAARSIDTTRRKAFVESGATLSTPRYALEQLENKVPYLSKSNIPYRNVWGEEDVSNPVWAVIENFLSPGYGQAIERDPVTEELRRIYQETDGNKAMIPKLPNKKLKDEALNAEQYDQLTLARGQTARQTLEALMQTDEWQLADDATKADMVGDVWTYANQTAGYQINDGVEKAAWVSLAEKEGNAPDSIIKRAVERNQKEYVNGHKESMLTSLEDGDVETALTSIEALKGAGKKKSSIQSYITNYFKPIWLEANDDERREIQMNLRALPGFTFDFRKWETGEEEEVEDFDPDWLRKP